jgi:hypothetical protein
MGLRIFNLRGLRGVRAEMGLAATVFNLTRMMKLIGIRELIKALNPKLA